MSDLTTTEKTESNESDADAAGEPQAGKKGRKRPASRSQRWNDAVAAAQAALEKLREAASDLETAAGDLRGVQEEYEEWHSNLPENLQSSALGEKLETVTGIDIESLADTITSAIDEVESVISEAEGADLPLGFGRD